MALAILIGLGLGPTLIAVSTDYLFGDESMLRYSMVLADYVRTRPTEEVASDDAARKTRQRYLEAIARVLGLTGPEAAAAVLSYVGGLVSTRFLFAGEPSFESQVSYLAALIEQGRDGG